MPFINISTSKRINNKEIIIEEFVLLISSLSNKSKRFVMAKIKDNSQMYFGDSSPCCFIEIKSIGSLNPQEMTKSICDFVFEKMGIPKDKIYISFEDVQASMWGWNGKTFG